MAEKRFTPEELVDECNRRLRAMKAPPEAYFRVNRHSVYAKQYRYGGWDPVKLQELADEVIKVWTQPWYRDPLQVFGVALLSSFAATGVVFLIDSKDLGG